MPELGLAEAIIIGLVLFVVFGPNRVADIGGGLGRAIRGFRRELSTDEASAPDPEPVAQPTATGEAARCRRCGGQLRESDKFCVNCGASVTEGAPAPGR